MVEYCLADGVSYDQVDDTYMVHVPATELIHVLNEPAGRVLASIDEGRSVEEIAGELAANVRSGSVSYDTVYQDVVQLILSFVKRDIVIES